jgi:hypothetical protein
MSDAKDPAAIISAEADNARGLMHEFLYQAEERGIVSGVEKLSLINDILEPHVRLLRMLAFAGAYEADLEWASGLISLVAMVSFLAGTSTPSEEALAYAEKELQRKLAEASRQNKASR